MPGKGKCILGRKEDCQCSILCHVLYHLEICIEFYIEEKKNLFFRVIRMVFMRHPSLVVRLVSALTPTIGMGPTGLQELIFRDIFEVTNDISELDVHFFV